MATTPDFVLCPQARAVPAAAESVIRALLEYVVHIPWAGILLMLSLTIPGLAPSPLAAARYISAAFLWGEAIPSPIIRKTYFASAAKACDVLTAAQRLKTKTAAIRTTPTFPNLLMFLVIQFHPLLYLPFQWTAFISGMTLSKNCNGKLYLLFRLSKNIVFCLGI